MHFTKYSKIIDSLVLNQPPLVLKSAATFNGIVVATTTSTEFVKVDADKFTKIRSATKIIVKYIMATAANGKDPVILKADQRFFLRVGVKTVLNL